MITKRPLSTSPHPRTIRKKDSDTFYVMLLTFYLTYKADCQAENHEVQPPSAVPMVTGVREHSVTCGVWAEKAHNSQMIRSSSRCLSYNYNERGRDEYCPYSLKKIRLHSALRNLFPKPPHFLDALKRHIRQNRRDEAFPLILAYGLGLIGSLSSTRQFWNRS